MDRCKLDTADIKNAPTEITFTDTVTAGDPVVIGGELLTREEMDEADRILREAAKNAP